VKNYHNTTNEGPDLFNYQAQAKSQDETVLEFIKTLGPKTFTCEDIHREVLPTAPLTSARRAVSNLHTEGHIEIVGKARGSYKRPIYLWRLI